MMGKYKDDRISFSYPDDCRLIKANEKHGQYDIEKPKQILIVIHFVPAEARHAIKRDILNCSSTEYDVVTPLGSVHIGQKEGIGLIATSFNPSHRFVQKRYRFLLTTATGGLYVEFIGDKEFDIDIYRELLESIMVKE
jgi:hypothetical protein